MRKSKITAQNVHGSSLAQNLPSNQFLTLFTDSQEKYKMEIHYFKGNNYNVAISYDYENLPRNAEIETISFYIRKNKNGELADKNKIDILGWSNFEINNLIKDIVARTKELDGQRDIKALEQDIEYNESLLPVSAVQGVNQELVCTKGYSEDFLEDVFNYILDNLELWGQIEPNDFKYIKLALESALGAFYEDNLVEAGYHLGEFKKYIRDRWDQRYAQEIEDLIYTILHNDEKEFYRMIKNEL